MYFSSINVIIIITTTMTKTTITKMATTMITRTITRNMCMSVRAYKKYFLRCFSSPVALTFCTHNEASSLFCYILLDFIYFLFSISFCLFFPPLLFSCYVSAVVCTILRGRHCFWSGSNMIVKELHKEQEVEWKKKRMNELMNEWMRKRKNQRKEKDKWKRWHWKEEQRKNTEK